MGCSDSAAKPVEEGSEGESRIPSTALRKGPGAPSGTTGEVGPRGIAAPGTPASEQPGLLELAAERAPGHAQEAGGLALVAAGPVQGVEEPLTLEGGDLGVPVVLGGGGRLAPGGGRRRGR